MYTERSGLLYMGWSGLSWNAPAFIARTRYSERIKAAAALYQIPEGVTRWGFPNQCRSDSRWRTKEVRHVDSDTIATGF